METYSSETHSMYMAQRARGYRNSLVCAGIAVAGTIFALYSTITSRAPEHVEPAPVVESIEGKFDENPGKSVPAGVLAGTIVSALGMAAGVKYAMDGVKADQKQFSYAINHG